MDLFLFQQINGLAGRWVYLDNLGVFFAAYFQYFLVGLVLVIFWKRWRVILRAFIAAILAIYGLVELIRFFWERPRPFIENNVNLLLEHSDTGSFPSGHAAFFFALSFVVYGYNKKFGILFFVASFLISISRVFAGVHWPSDIMAGMIVGIFSGWLVRKFFKKEK